MNSSPADGDGEQHDPARTTRSLNFDRLAPIYRWMEWFSFGPYLARARRMFLPQMATARRALVLGDGDGRFTASLLHTNKQIEIHAIDVSTAMLRSLGRRAGADAARVHTETADLRNWQPPAATAYDLVVTHFFLDCLTSEEIRNLAQRIRPHLSANAQWVVSEFDRPAGLFGRLVAQPIIALLYGAFGLLTGLPVRRLPDYRADLETAGLALVREEPLLHGLLVSELWRAE